MEPTKSKNTFVLGLGFQKCGTSWLYRYLQQSEKFDGGELKEYHIWDAIDIPILRYYTVNRPGLGHGIDPDGISAGMEFVKKIINL